jgi:outer membrane scaffolding protein for murein synthesis (MipA/OmpV family)
MKKPTPLAAPKPQTVRALGLLLLAATGWALASQARAQAAAEPPAATPYSLTVGLGVARLPEYEGSDRFDVRALPIISYRSGRFFAGTLSGVGYNLSNTPALEFGPVVSYRFGRDESDSPRLRGLGNIDAGADLGAFARWNAQAFTLGARLERGVGGNAKGTSLRLDAGYALAINQSNALRFDASVDWADRDVMQGFFGISAPQSLSSGLPAYTASSGIRRYGVSAVWAHNFTPNWVSTVRVGIYRLGDEAASSPLTLKRNTGLVSAGLSYRF